jgi:hypothetical protein
VFNAAIEKFVGEVRTAKQPLFTTDTQVVCGRVVLTATPNLESDAVQAYRLEFPTNYDLRECPYPFLFIVSVFDAETLLRIQPKIGPAMRAGREYSERINGWLFRTFLISSLSPVIVGGVS